MKFILINSYVKEDMGIAPPLGLGYLAAVLEEEGHEVRIIDREILKRKNDNDKKVIDKITINIIKKEKPDFVGITATTAQIMDGYYVSKFVKATSPNTKIILGGVHPSVLPIQTMKECKECDMIVIGEGERTIVDIAKGMKLKDILGIVYKDNGKIKITKTRPIIKNLDDIPFPARHLLDMDYYTKPRPIVIRGIELRGTHLFTARGCPYRCTFCVGGKYFGNKVRFNSLKYVIKEVEHILDNYDVECLLFWEDMFLLNRKRAEKICKEFIRRGINERIVWSCQLKVNSVDKDILKLMKKAGCVQVEYGFESASQRVLDRIKKASTVEQNYRAARLTHEAGIKILANIMVGLIDEREEDILKSIQFIKDIKPEYIGFYKFTPLPGSADYEELKQKGFVVDYDWNKFNVGIRSTKDVNFTKMGLAEFRRMFDKFNKEYVQPTLDKNYLKSNITRHPLRMINTLSQKFLGDPKGVIKRVFNSISR